MLLTNIYQVLFNLSVDPLCAPFAASRWILAVPGLWNCKIFVFDKVMQHKSSRKHATHKTSQLHLSMDAPSAVKSICGSLVCFVCSVIHQWVLGVLHLQRHPSVGPWCASFAASSTSGSLVYKNFEQINTLGADPEIFQKIWKMFIHIINAYRIYT